MRSNRKKRGSSFVEKGNRIVKELKNGDVTDRLYAAVAEYIEDKGGSVAVIGGIQIQEWPGEASLKFTVGIKCIGRKPTFKGKP